jgi:predicted kinase
MSCYAKYTNTPHLLSTLPWSQPGKDDTCVRGQSETARRSVTVMQPHPVLERIMCGEPLALTDFRDALRYEIDLLPVLERTPQDPQWHAEGNVAIHTDLVLAETYRQLDEQGLGPRTRLVRVLAALLHDIGKPLTTRTEEQDGRKRVISPRHADRGRSYLARKLPALGLPSEVIDDVMALVGHHHDLKRAVTSSRTPFDYHRLARLVSLEELYWLEQANMRGRHAPDVQEQLDVVELFKFEAQDRNVWNTRDPYEDWREVVVGELAALPSVTKAFVVAQGVLDAEAGRIFTPQEAVARSYRYRDAHPELVVLCGPSGSGKTSYVHQWLPEHVHIDLNGLREELTGDPLDQSENGRVMQQAKERLRAALRAKQRVVWDATNLRKQHRDVILGLGFGYHAYTHLLAFRGADDTYARRNAGRQHAVGGDVLERQLQGWEFPYATEAHAFTVVDLTENED